MRDRGLMLHGHSEASVMLLSAVFCVALALPLSSSGAGQPRFVLEESSIAQTSAAMTRREITSVELTVRYLNRIAVFDRGLLKLNAVPVLNPKAIEQAAAADSLRRSGAPVGLLQGIPYTAKDNYMVRGLSTTLGSPALANLLAPRNAFVIEELDKAGAVLLGKTNLDPMVLGSGSPSLYGKGRNPYNLDAPTTGSSYGAAIAEAANLATFSLGTETAGSIRGPASYQSVVGFRPGKGLISAFGIGPLMPEADTPGVLTRSVQDAATVLDAIVVDDDRDVLQKYFGPPSARRPPSYLKLLAGASLAGKRVGVPRPYIGKDLSGTKGYKLSPRVEPIWEMAVRAMQEQGAEVVEVDWPLFHSWEEDTEWGRTESPRHGTDAFGKYWQNAVRYDIAARAIDDFVKMHGTPFVPSFGDIPSDVFMADPIDNSFNERWISARDEAKANRAKNLTDMADGKQLGEIILSGFHKWLERDVFSVAHSDRIDFIAYPAMNNVPPLPDSEQDRLYAPDGNFPELGFFGLPAVIIPLGYMPDSNVPLGLALTMVKLDSEGELLRYAAAAQNALPARKPPELTPALPSEVMRTDPNPLQVRDLQPPEVRMSLPDGVPTEGGRVIISGAASDDKGLFLVEMFVNGRSVLYQPVSGLNADFKVELARARLKEWSDDRNRLNVTVLVRDQGNNATAVQGVLRLL